MRELSACDFCGGDAAGVYEVVPGDIPGVSARRMVLCEGCRDTLADIVDPLLEAGRAGGRAKSKSEARVQEGADTAPGAGRAGELAAGSEADSGAESKSETPPDTDSRAESGPDPESDSQPTSKQSIEPEPVPSTEPESESGQEPEPEPSKPERVERPDGYGKVVRLVENRDDEIERADLAELATSAYGLSHSTVDEAIDFAIEYGTFEETDNGLKTT